MSYAIYVSSNRGRLNDISARSGLTQIFVFDIISGVDLAFKLIFPESEAINCHDLLRAVHLIEVVLVRTEILIV